MGCNCGKARRQGTREALANQVAHDRKHTDPTRALFAAAKPMYEVVGLAGASGRGKRFSSLAAAQDWARKNPGSTLRTL